MGGYSRRGLVVEVVFGLFFRELVSGGDLGSPWVWVLVDLGQCR